jgi:FKBP-type peptidyl-prolyl cis-trans isomerase
MSAAKVKVGGMTAAMSVNSKPGARAAKPSAAAVSSARATKPKPTATAAQATATASKPSAKTASKVKVAVSGRSGAALRQAATARMTLGAAVPRSARGGSFASGETFATARRGYVPSVEIQIKSASGVLFALLHK